MNKTYEIYIKSHAFGVPDFETTIEAKSLTEARDKFAQDYLFELEEKDIREVKDNE